MNESVKCELCKCFINKDDAVLLPYSKGDYFCNSCYNILLGCKRCVVCDEEFYYSKRSAYKLTCRKFKCHNKYYSIINKINKNIKLNNDELLIYNKILEEK